MTSKHVGESEDLLAIQAQLQLDRAQLTNEISNRLISISASSSPSKSNGTNGTMQKNPFSMSKANPASTSSSMSMFSSSASSSSPFNHRPATLGLGAEPSEDDRKQASSNVENARLKGALVGKRKRDVRSPDRLDREDIEEESKSHAIGKGKGKETLVKGNGRAANKNDPFASKKGKEKGKGKVPEPNAVTTKPSLSTEPSPEQLAGLSKSARKKLRKKMKREIEESEPLNILEDVEVEQPIVSTEKPQTKKDANAESNSMTAHQKSLLSHLSGARFRQINETLYTTSSSSAMAYIQGEPAKLQEYHEGFREQVKSWPKIPVRQIAERILKGQKQSQIGGSGKQHQQRSGRFAQGALIVDLGAGEAILGKLLAKDATTFVRVLSYDLLDSEDGWVNGLDIAKLKGLPLPGKLGSERDDEESSRVVDVAVFCLSLMGTNWVEMIMEASRILRTNGELIIAEVTSRFNEKADFINVVSSLGFKLINEDTTNSHFVLFEFVKLGPGKWDAKGLLDDQERESMIETGAKILKPCIYKRR